MIIAKSHHEEVVGQLAARLADKQAELDRVLAELSAVRGERDQFRSLFVKAMGEKWNENPVQEFPLQTVTLKPDAVEDFAQVSSRWSPAESTLYECWLRDEGKDLMEPARVWMERFGGASPMEVLQ